MSESGTTPSIGLVSAILERINLPVFVMIRPRGGDFMFEDAELDVMRRDIDALKRAGVHGVVSGALGHGGVIDVEATRSLVDAADPLPFTFHRAFDLVPELEFAVDQLRSIGVRRVLTSGGATTALVGADAIARLAQRAGNSMTLVAGGAVRADHVVDLVRTAGVTEVHARPTRMRHSGMQLARELRFGVAAASPQRAELDSDSIRAIALALQTG